MKCNLIKLSQWKVTIFTCNLNIKIMNSMTFFRAVSQQTEFTKSKCLETNLHQNAVMKWSALWFIFTDAVSAKGLVCRIWGQKWNIIGLHLCVVSLETKRSEPFFFFFYICRGSRSYIAMFLQQTRMDKPNSGSREGLLWLHF